MNAPAAQDAALADAEDTRPATRPLPRTVQVDAQRISSLVAAEQRFVDLATKVYQFEQAAGITISERPGEIGEAVRLVLALDPGSLRGDLGSVLASLGSAATEVRRALDRLPAAAQDRDV
jgi:hypothetical protein